MLEVVEVVRRDGPVRVERRSLAVGEGPSSWGDFFSQQMRWSRRGADLLLQVRCAGFNGKFGSSFGQLFQIVDPASELAMAA